MIQLQTDRLTFHRYHQDDLPFVTQLVKNENVMRYIGDGMKKDEQYARELIERMQEQYANFGDYGLHLLRLKETNEPIGHAGIVAQIIDDAFELEIGYWIDEPYWNKGYAKEAALALMQYADEEMELERYVCLVQEGNHASEKIAYSMGMTLTKIIVMEEKRVQFFLKLNE